MTVEYRFSDEDEAFRADVRAFFEAELPPDHWRMQNDRDEVSEAEAAFGRRFVQRLADRGWLTLHWPTEFGGLGASPMQQLIFNEESGYFKAPGGGMGVQMAGPSIMHHGTDAQKEKHLSAIANGEEGLVPGLLRARLRFRPRLAADAGRARRRRLRGQRPEDLDQRRPSRRLVHAARAHRPRRAQAPRHHLPADGYEEPRRDRAPPGQHAGLARLQRDLPGGRARAALERRGRGEPRLVRRDDDAGLRAQRHLPHRLGGSRARGDGGLHPRPRRAAHSPRPQPVGRPLDRLGGLAAAGLSGDVAAIAGPGAELRGVDVEGGSAPKCRPRSRAWAST